MVERGAWKPSAEEGGSSLTQDWRRLARVEDQCSKASGVLTWCSSRPSGQLVEDRTVMVLLQGRR